MFQILLKDNQSQMNTITNYHQHSLPPKDRKRSGSWCFQQILSSKKIILIIVEMGRFVFRLKTLFSTSIVSLSNPITLQMGWWNLSNCLHNLNRCWRYGTQSKFSQSISMQKEMFTRLWTCNFLSATTKSSWTSSAKYLIFLSGISLVIKISWSKNRSTSIFSPC